jgi:hypothetical protein
VLFCCVGQIATYPIAYAAIYRAVLDQEATWPDWCSGTSYFLI